MNRPRTVFALTVLLAGVLSILQVVRATEASGIGADKDAIGEPIASNARLSLRLPLPTNSTLSLGAVTESSAAQPSASELNRELTNPVSSIWSISNQFNNFELNNGHWNNNWNFQPVLPISLTKDWNLITRPVMPFYNIVPHPTISGEWERDAGLGDLALLELLSPANWSACSNPR